MCAFLGKGKGTPPMHGHNESYTDLNLKKFTKHFLKLNQVKCHEENKLKGHMISQMSFK